MSDSPSSESARVRSECVQRFIELAEQFDKVQGIRASNGLIFTIRQHESSHEPVPAAARTLLLALDAHGIAEFDNAADFLGQLPQSHYFHQHVVPVGKTSLDHQLVGQAPIDALWDVWRFSMRFLLEKMSDEFEGAEDCFTWTRVLLNDDGRVVSPDGIPVDLNLDTKLVNDFAPRAKVWAKACRLFAKLITTPSVQQPRSQETTRTEKKRDSEKKSWTQKDLDKAIREYKAKRASTYNDLRIAVHAGKKGASKSARESYGRNAIVRALGVKSQAMVSNSPAWREIARELCLEKKAREKKVGLEIASEERSFQIGDLTTSQVIRNETIQRVRRAMNQQAADETVDKLQLDRMTDDEARNLVKLYEEQEKDKKS